MADDTRLARALAAARSAHPGIAVDASDFARRVATCTAEATDPDAAIDALAAADLYLAIACERGDTRALASLEAEVLAHVPSFVAAVASDRDAADEIRQRVRERLLVASDPTSPPKIAEYAGRGPLGAFVRVIAVRIALDLHRRDRPRDLDEAPVLDPELSMIRDRYRAPFEAAIRDAFGELSAEERSWLRLHFFEGWNLDRLAIVFGVSRATAGRRILALRERLAARTKELLAERLGATPDEVASLVAVLRSHLHHSLRSALGE